MKLPVALFVLAAGIGLIFSLKTIGDSAGMPAGGAESAGPAAQAQPTSAGQDRHVAMKADVARVTPVQASKINNARIIGSGIIAAPQVSGEIERVPARPSLSPAPHKKKHPAAGDPSQWRLRLLHQPIALSAGEIEASGYRLVLSGIVPTDPALICKTAAGEDWPCGLRARTEFRAFLRARSVRCKVPDKPAGQTLQTECSLAGEDVAKWLVAQGWAAPADGAAPQGLGLSGPPPD